MKKSSVAFLLSTLEVGGSERKTVRLANRLLARGWCVHLLYLNHPDTLLGEIDSAVNVRCLYRKGKVSLPAISRLRCHLIDHDIRNIVAMNLYPSIYASSVGLLIRTHPIKQIVAVNTTDHLKKSDQIQMLLYGPLLRHADRIIFGCKIQMAGWAKRYALSDDRCSVIYNGVDASRFRPVSSEKGRAEERRKLGFSTDDFVVGTVGQLRPEKAHQQVIEAISRLRSGIPRIKGLIVGEGPERFSLEQRVRDSNLIDRISLLGEVEDVRAALSVMDVFVLPSVAVETFSNAALEAMATGTPVILSEVGGSREMVTDGVDGRVFSPGDIEGLTRILKELAGDAVGRLRMGIAARSKVEEQFAFSRMVESYEQVLMAPHT